MINDKRKLIFVDSDAFVALAKENDTNHEKAVRLLKQLLTEPVSFITSNYVFSETVTVISMRIGHEQAVAFIKKMKSPANEFEIKWVNAHIEEVAIEIFENQTSKNTSFVDCTNLAFVKQLGVDAIFSFDEVYKKNGLPTVEYLSQ